MVLSLQSQSSKLSVNCDICHKVKYQGYPGCLIVLIIAVAKMHVILLARSECV